MKDITFKNLTDEQINAIKVLLSDTCEIEEQKEEEKDTSFPKTGDEYYFIISDGEIDINICSGSPLSLNRISIGNCFRTEEEAEFEVERLKVIAELKEWATPISEFTWSDDTRKYMYVIVVANMGENSCLAVDFYYTNQVSDLCFQSEEIAKSAIEAVGEDRIIKYYFRR